MALLSLRSSTVVTYLTITTTLLLLSLSQLSSVFGDGVQSGPSPGAFYAGGMFFDKGNEMLYVTGSHYNTDLDELDMKGTSLDSESNCFIAAVDFTDDGSFGEFADWNTYGNPNVMETCSSIALYSPSELVVVGSAEPGGFVTGSEGIQLSGIVSIMTKTDLQFVSGIPLTQGDDQQNNFLYPMAVVSDGKNAMYIAALTSTDATENEANSQFPNWQEVQKYGSSLDMTVIKVELSQPTFDGVPEGGVVADDTWYSVFPINKEANGEMPRVYIGGLIYKQTTDGRELVIIAGSTRGLGTGYGDAVGDDEDGFLTVLDPSDGQLYPGIVSNKREGSAEDDIVTGICDDPNDPSVFYIVGATKGKDLGDQQASAGFADDVVEGSLQPFVRKVNVDQLEAVWTKQWAAVPSTSGSQAFAFARDCFVDGSSIYVAGNVDSYASMVQGQAQQLSQGGADIWAAQLTLSDGEVQWLTQLGSSGDEKLAPYGGISLSNQGDVIISGYTDGSMYRQRSSGETASDVFVMTLSSVTGKTLDTDFLGGSSTWTLSFTGNPPDIPVEDLTDSPVSAPENMAPQPTHQPLIPRPGDIGPHSYTPIGLQITGPAYAGAISYDDVRNAVFIVGSDFLANDLSTSPTSLCFTGLVNLRDGDLVTKYSRGTPTHQEACNSVAFNSQSNAAYAIGTAEAGSGQIFESALWNPSVSNAVESGFILQLHANLGVIGGNRDGGYPVIYPMDVMTEPTGQYVYVASMASNDEGVVGVPQSQYPDFTSGGAREYGTDFFLKVDRYYVQGVPDSYTDPLPATLQSDWTMDYSPDSGLVLVSGMALVEGGSSLVVVGSTRASGGPFNENDGDGDMDGWILKLDPNTGELSKGSGSRSSTRLDSANKKDDYILNVCNDRFDHDSFYVVGTSFGKIRTLPDDQQPPEGSKHAFVAKVSVDDLSAEWLKHFTMTSPSGGVVEGEAVACTVTPDSEGTNIVYVGGNVRKGALLDGVTDITESHGGDDIFVASMDGGSGDLNWITQIGTSDQDTLAAGQALDVDYYGNAIVFGNTRGSLYSSHDSGSGESDMVLFTVNKKDGSYLTPTTSGDVVGDDEAHIKNPTTWYPPSSSSTSETRYLAFGITAAVLAFLALFSYCLVRRQRRKRIETQKSSIFAYLQQFDVEDIDLRKSPPGGWHGTYLNKLAYGINKAEQNGRMLDGDGNTAFETAPLTHSSLVKDSLFMDTSTPPSLGYRVDNGYDDLQTRSPKEVI